MTVHLQGVITRSGQKAALSSFNPKMSVSIQKRLGTVKMLFCIVDISQTSKRQSGWGAERHLADQLWDPRKAVEAAEQIEASSGMAPTQTDLPRPDPMTTPMHSVIHSVIHPFFHPSILSSILSTIHSFIHSVNHPSIHPSIHPSVHLSIHPFIHSFILSFIHAFVSHSFMHSLNPRNLILPIQWVGDIQAWVDSYMRSYNHKQVSETKCHAGLSAQASTKVDQRRHQACFVAARRQCHAAGMNHALKFGQVK